MSKKTEISYAEAIGEVETILERFDREEMSVDELGASVKRAAELIRLCRLKLRQAESEVAEALREDSETEKGQA